jgi:hypothetical protein
MIDLLVYRRDSRGKYEYMLIDWKRSRNPNFVDKNKDLTYIPKYKNIISPLKGYTYSTHLKNSLQLHSYLYMLQKYYSKGFFLFHEDQSFKMINVYFSDKYTSYHIKYAMDLKEVVKKMFEMINNGIINI